ncbi:AAA domain-containing protein [Roseibium marinum]|uniref:Helicase-like protein n=1 Tax=Roseibium marinum TaxID=281252 RepID=A0A2S3UYK5_9HYPH|nr:AAA domain-containing protein [Roseibium marinum]POF32613.1 helicase-like protein [Roseibium marinum]
MSVRQEILTFLRDPTAFSLEATDPEIWRAALEEFAEPSLTHHGEHPLRPAQREAWSGLASARAGLVLGPPGTGKTHLLSWMILGYVHSRRAAGLPARVYVTAFTRNAVGNLLDAVAERARVHWPGGFGLHFFGNAPPAGLSQHIHHRPRLDGSHGTDAFADLSDEAVVVGSSIWSLYRLLQHPESGSDDAYTAGLFDLVCIDEASQMVLSHGLMAIAGLRSSGRVVVAGDDRQLPPIRAAREVTLGERQIGGSLYGFLKSAEVPEFALDETFRLNAPLTAFPERKFYPGVYRSAVQTRRLELAPDWKLGLEPWEAAVLDPDWPVAVLLHDGPPAATSNDFEAGLAAQLAGRLAERMVGVDAVADGALAADFWVQRLAMVSPHRSQNAKIRNALPDRLRAGAFVETVDRIQGKERDAVVLSYCVADAEFALAEADFIFAPERLNVAITRARAKLIVLVSRRLLEAVPADQEQMDKAELLREFVFSAEATGEIDLRGPSGSRVKVQIRLSGFGGAPEFEEIAVVAEATQEVPVGELEELLGAVRAIALTSRYGTATIRDLQRHLATRDDLLPGLAQLHSRGRLSLEPKLSRDGQFWTARPLDPARSVFSADPDTVRRHTEEAISQARSGRLSPFYERVRGYFAWMDGTGEDVLKPVFDTLKDEGRLRYGMARGRLTVDWVEEEPQAIEVPSDTAPELSDDDFAVLNALEDLEAGRINFGIFEAWASAAGLADQTRFSREVVTAALARLAATGWIMLASDGRVRSRMAELAREIRYVKQRFRHDDADRRPYLVRGLKIELRDRNKPERSEPVAATFTRVASQLSGSHALALQGLSNALTRLWGQGSSMASFQVRSLEALSFGWNGGGGDTFVVAADTGSGKTEAAALPLIAGAAADKIAGIAGVRAVLAYPRIRLATNQAQRLARYLAALAGEPGMPVVTLGLQTGQVPERFDNLNERERQAGWSPLGSGEFTFPFFACPSCAGDLILAAGGGTAGADRLACVKCDWSYAGWVGSKVALREEPPAFFLPTTDSLHQWLHDTRCGRLFGDDPDYAAPRAMLADEIHLYSHVHGAQVGYTLRRLAARAQSNTSLAHPILAVGMSATLGDPVTAWGRLVDREQVGLLAPTDDEKRPNPRGREYFYFVQPEVESRGHDIAGASTTIQSLMCLAHGMRRRTGGEGGFRAIAFLDSIDRIRRLHAAYDDAEMAKRLAAYRTRSYPDDPLTGRPRTTCCGEPHGCDTFREGECWFFAATDAVQRGARGLRRPGNPLRVADQPIFSGATGRVEALIKDSDIVFATSSLEVGYDDPDITLVYQHYAPLNLASFIQRKGRGGRGADDRPITAATLSIYSSRDSWWFRRPHEMIEPATFETPLNPGNHFVRRGQVLAIMLDAFARWQWRQGASFELASPPQQALNEAEELAARVFGPEAWREFDKASLLDLWLQALSTASNNKRLTYLSDFRSAVEWVPNVLFDTINLPRLAVHAGTSEPRPEDIALAVAAAAPGNASRRYDGVEVHWRPPINGKGPWLATEDYAAQETRRPLGDDPEAWLARLPDDARPLLSRLSPDYFRPKRITLEPLGRMHGTGWQSDWVVPDPAAPVVARAQIGAGAIRAVRHDSRGALRGFPVVKAASERARGLESSGLAPLVERVEYFVGDGVGGKETGLALARVFWGADAELNLDGQQSETATFSQVFTAPDDDRPLLHGYHVQTEGVRFRLDATHLDTFVAEEAARLKEDAPTRRWHTGQMLRFLVESKSQAQGVNAYEARRGAELIVSAAGEPEFRKRLVRLLNFWSPQNLAELFEDTRAGMLSQHPLLSRARVARVADTLSDQRFQAIFKASVDATTNEDDFGRYLKSAVLHSLAVRLKESFVQIGRGDERRVAMHVQLPIQFADPGDPVITICETGAFGDGTARCFVEDFEACVRHWTDGFIGDCPNAREDIILRRFFEQERLHEHWRQLDPNDPTALSVLAAPLGLEADSPVPSTILRILFGSEQVGFEQFDLYDLACSIRATDELLLSRLGRMPSAWELTSVMVEHGRENSSSPSGQLLAAYSSLEDAAQEESLSPSGRLADQIFRLHARLCVDGCRACTHQSSDMMTDGMVEASTSRSLLNRFLSNS